MSAIAEDRKKLQALWAWSEDVFVTSEDVREYVASELVTEETTLEEIREYIMDLLHILEEWGYLI